MNGLREPRPRWAKSSRPAARLICCGLFGLLAACSGLGPEVVPTSTAPSGLGGPILPTLPPRPPGGLSCSDPFAGVEPAFSLAGWPETDFCLHSIDFVDVVSGGQPRDGIPPIESPVYETVEAASAWMQDPWPVLVIVGSGETLGFPLPILLWHEVVNTVVDSTPVSVTFAPLSGSARVYVGRGSTTPPPSFGTTGNLRFGNSILYDRSTESWWQQMTGEGIVGERTGASMEILASQLVPWDVFREEYPDGQVLSRETGVIREYGLSPYAGIEGSEELPSLLQSFLTGEVDRRLSPMEWIAGIPSTGSASAFPFSLLRAERVVHGEAADRPIAVFWQPGAASVNDTARISESRDVGWVGAFDREIAGRTLTFEASGDTIRDRETGSTWSATGRAVAGPMLGQTLRPIDFVAAYWYAWAALFPETVIETR